MTPHRQTSRTKHLLNLAAVADEVIRLRQRAAEHFHAERYQLALRDHLNCEAFAQAAHDYARHHAAQVAA